MIRVSVAASSAIVRAGLEAVIRSSDALKLAEVFRTDEIENGTQRITGDVLLLEIPHVDEDSLGTLFDTSVPVVLLTETTDSAFLTAAFRSGIRAVLSPAGCRPVLWPGRPGC